MDATISAAWIAAGATVFVAATAWLFYELRRMEGNRREDVRDLHKRINELQNHMTALMKDHEKENGDWREKVARELGEIQGAKNVRRAGSTTDQSA